MKIIAKKEKKDTKIEHSKLESIGSHSNSTMNLIINSIEYNTYGIVQNIYKIEEK